MKNHLEKPRSRVVILALLVLVVVLGLASRRLPEWLPLFVSEHAGDVLWTVAAYLTLAFIFPHWSPWRLGLIAFGISVAVELSQLVDVDWLKAIRETTPGRLLLGAGFVWIDLVRYLTGAVLATLGDWWLIQRKLAVPDGDHVNPESPPEHRQN